MIFITTITLASVLRYEILREKLLLEMLKCHIGEGMWAVLSENEQLERLMQLKLRVRKLRKDGKMEAAVSLPGAGLVYSTNLLALMGYSRAGAKQLREEEAEMKKSMEAQGMVLSLSGIVTESFRDSKLLPSCPTATTGRERGRKLARMHSMP